MQIGKMLLKKMPTMSDLKNRIYSILFEPKQAYSLAIFRILFGIVMFFEFKGFYFYFLGEIQESRFLFTYDFFHWLKLLDRESIAILYIILFIALLFFTLGLFYRLAALIIFLGFTYSFLLDIGHYNNHYYFYCLVLFWFVITNANQCISLDRFFGRIPKTNFIPRWQLLGFQLQIFIVYFMGGIAKINYDWLQGYPMRLWLFHNSTKYTGWFQTFLQTESAAYLFSYLGIAFDLTVGFLLFFRKTKFWVTIPIILFHLFNHFTWDIGTFPWAMIATCLLFFYPEDFTNKSLTKKISFNYSNLHQKTISTFFIIWFAIHLLIPLRHLTYKGNPSWTGEGHFFAWRMMLVDISATIDIKIYSDNIDDIIYLNINDFLTKRQLKKLIRSPKDIIRFCAFLKKDVEEKTAMIDPQIRLEVWKSINERPPQLLNDTTLNYGNLNNVKWIKPWHPKDDELKFTLKQYQNWDNHLNKKPNQTIYY